MGAKIVISLLLLLCCTYISCENENVEKEANLQSPETDEGEIDYETYLKRLDNYSMIFEKGLKRGVKTVVKMLMPTMMSFNDGPSITSPKCLNSILKYISGLTAVKVWAVKMLDATYKIPSGMFEGTLSEVGDFDECLEQYLPTRSGKIEFRGKYCAIEGRPIMPPQPRNFSIGHITFAKPLDSVLDELNHVYTSFHYLKSRLGICVPSTCTLEDIRGIANKLAELTEMEIKIPQCYVKEDAVFKPVHIVFIFIMSVLLVVCLTGSVMEYKIMNIPLPERKLTTRQQVLICFSFISNYRRLMSSSKGSEELKVLHGLRALSIAWVILGHTYVWFNLHLFRRPNNSLLWGGIGMGTIFNAWMSVEPFFFLSGFLTSYAVMKILPITKGRINIPIFVFRRFLRFTPPLLLAIGVTFFMPLVSSGPFWYERPQPEIKSCTKYWWRSILYISNWFGMKNMCMHSTWYLSADFQLYVMSIVFILTLYRFPKLGLVLIGVFILACTIMVGTLTYIWELPPIILVSSGNEEQILETIDNVHMNTFTHVGPYYVGIVVGYLIHKYKSIRMSKMTVASGWMLSTVLALTSVYGINTWVIGQPHGPFLTALYAGVHRTTFVMAVAWVAFASITGYGGLVNQFLSSSMLAPMSRLTFMMYLLHGPVMWTRIGSLRERLYMSNYNMIYEYFGHLVIAFVISIPFYLLLESPFSNVERLVFSRMASKYTEKESQSKGHLQTSMANSSGKIGMRKKEDTRNVPVELTAVKNLENGCNNLSFNGDAEIAKLY